MKQKFIKSWLISLMLLATFAVQAQVVSWENSSPSLSSPVIGIMSENVTLNLQFTLAVASAQEATENAKPKVVVLQLPDGIKVVSAAKGGTGAAIVPGTPIRNGTEVRIPITSMTYNKMVHLAVVLRADDCETIIGNDDISVGILSNDIPLPGAAIIAGINIAHPDVVATPGPNPPTGAVNSIVPFLVPMSVTNGININEMKITLHKDNFTFLSNITLPGFTITPTEESDTAVVLEITGNIGRSPKNTDIQCPRHCERNTCHQSPIRLSDKQPLYLQCRVF